MNKAKYSHILSMLLDSLEEEEKIKSHHKQILKNMVDDLIYDGRLREYTIKKIKELEEWKEY